MSYICITIVSHTHTLGTMSRVLHVEKPTPNLLTFVRGLKEQKDADKKKLSAKKDVYFPKK